MGKLVKALASRYFDNNFMLVDVATLWFYDN